MKFPINTENKRSFDLKRASAFLFCIVFFLFGQKSLQACDCKDSLSFETAIGQADYAFRGEVIGYQTNWISGGWKFTFKAFESWKKQVSEVLVINTAWEKDCGFVFEKGGEYMVFVQRKFTPKTFQCMGNRLIKEGDEVHVKVLGESFLPAPSAMSHQMNLVLVALACVSLLFVGLVVLRKRFVK